MQSARYRIGQSGGLTLVELNRRTRFRVRQRRPGGSWVTLLTAFLTGYTDRDRLLRWQISGFIDEHLRAEATVDQLDPAATTRTQEFVDQVAAGVGASAGT